MLAVLVGPMCSGKTTLSKALNEYKGYIRNITYTTRPIRDGEEDGVDYHFISEEEFKSKIIDSSEPKLSCDVFTEYKEHNYNGKHIYYGSIIRNEDILSDRKYVIVLDPDGVTELLAYVKNSDIPRDNIVVVYLDIQEHTCYYRAKLRGDNFGEVLNRIQYEEIHKFIPFRKSGNIDIRFWESFGIVDMVENIERKFQSI